MKFRHLIVLLAGAAALHSCQGKSEYKALDNSTSDTDLVAADSIAPNQPKLIKTADMRFKVGNVTQTSEKISALTASSQGMVMHHEMHAELTRSNEIKLPGDSVMRVSAFNTTADMTLKLPTEKLDAFMNQIGHLGTYVTYRKMDIEDKSLDYLEAQLKMNSRNELVKGQNSGRLKIKDATQVLYFKDELVDQQINKRRIDDAVKYSVVTLSFYQSNIIVKEVIVNDDPTAYNITFMSRLGLAINNGLQIFADVLIGLTNLWAFILAGIMIWIGFRAYKSKHPAFFAGKPVN